MQAGNSSRFAVFSTLVALVALFALSWLGRPSEDAIVVYCAHDSVYSEEILRDFERATGIPVVIRFDTEATKSLALVDLLIFEKESPQCDVFWNNELFGTIRLQKAGVLASYKGPGFERIPEQFRDPDGFWTGFAARLRVFIINSDLMPANEATIEKRLAGDLSRMAIAKPLYGTTRTHYTALWHVLGGDGLAELHADMRSRGAIEVDGNAVVKNLVAAGRCDLGWTDTDDFFLAKDDKFPVEMMPIRIPDGRTISIPNSVAIISGCRHRTAAERLVDFLLSEEVELRLANSRSRQIPLGPVDDSRLPEDVRSLLEPASEAVNLAELGNAQAECLKWLQSEYSK